MNETGNIDITGIAVALGRIEEKVSHLTGMDERLRKVESDLTELKAQQKPKTPWYIVVGGLAGIGSLIITASAIWVFMSRVADIFAQ